VFDLIDVEKEFKLPRSYGRKRGRRRAVVVLSASSKNVKGIVALPGTCFVRTGNHAEVHLLTISSRVLVFVFSDSDLID
jgi:hypothetical protein